MSKEESTPGTAGTDFIRSIVARDVASGKYGSRVVTRFPPEPNGYLHIGHAKAIGVSYGVATDFDGTFHLRFDDTNPTAEETEYVEGMKRDMRWLGVDWGEHCYFTSSYFDQLYEFARELVRRGKAFVCDLSSEEIAAHRGTLTEPGRNSPYRDRSAEENLDLFTRMKQGEFENGDRTLRAKIDMASPNLVMRDPILYRVHKVSHHRTGDAWCVYPMYDFAHCLSDSIEDITHSLCSLEFADHKALYDWILDELELSSHPEQIEFARLNLSHTVMSKRVLRSLVEDGHVAGWDDPRMPTLTAMRRRGYPPTAIRSFIESVGVAKRENLIQLARLEASVRDELNRTAPRVMGVLNPLRVVIENYPEGESEQLAAVNNPEDESAGTRQVPFSRVLYIERDDFLEDPPKKFFRLAPGREVRLRYAYFITCTSVVKDAAGEVVELRCSYDPATRGGDAPDGRKVKGTLHWVSAEHALGAELRLYNPLFTVENPLAEDGEFTEYLAADSLVRLSDALVEPSVAGAIPGAHYQFERQGYFSVDPDSSDERPVFNRTVTLRDSWAKIAGKRGVPPVTLSGDRAESFDVVIVGGGIGGSSLGAGLAEGGRRVLLLERTTTFEDRVRGEWIAPWGVDEAKRLGLFDTLVAAGGHTVTRNAAFDELLSATDAEAAIVDLGTVHPGAAGPLCLEHVTMQNTLLERARRAGVEVRRGVAGVEVDVSASPVARFRHEGASHTVDCRLVVGADGRASGVRRAAGIPLHEDPVDHLIAGLLVEGAHDWPEDLQSTGKVGDLYYLAFPQGGGKVRLYADYDIEQRSRFSGADGAAAFLRCFDMDCVPHSASLAGATPIGPCASFPSQDAWTERPFAPGVVLVGDAAGYNDPIIGQGISVTLRDARTVRDLLLSGEPWEPALFEPYADERRERMRRLRLAAVFVTNFFARFGDEAVARRKRARVRVDENPGLAAIALTAFSGPDLLPAEIYSEEAVERLFAA